MRKMEWILKIKEMVLCLLKQGHKKFKIAVAPAFV